MSWFDAAPRATVILGTAIVLGLANALAAAPVGPAGLTGEFPEYKMENPQSGYPTELMGQSVALEGDTMVVGVGFRTQVDTDKFSPVLVYVRDGADGWILEGVLTAADSSICREFGRSVAISGNTVVVGASEDDAGTTRTNTGSAYVFIREGTSWSQQARLTAADAESGDKFGHSVAIS